MVAFCWTVPKCHWLFCVGILDCELWVYFKIRISIASQEKGNNMLYNATEMGATTFNSQQLKIWRGTSWLLRQNRKCSREGEFELSNVNFAQKWVVRVLDFWNVFRVCMEFNFLSTEVIKSQECLRISFSSPLSKIL